jgi:RecB family exonuclease
MVEKSGGRDYLSFSAISLFQQCPLRYMFRYLLGLPEEVVSASLVFGGAIHAAVQFHFEQLLAGGTAPSLDTLLDVYQDAWHGREGQTVLFNKGEDANALGRLADRMLTGFQRSDFAQPSGTIIGVEEELRGELLPGCPDLLARIDLIVDTGDAVVVTDFKTARREWSQGQVYDSAPQLLLYSELVKHLADGKPLRLAFAVMTKTAIPFLALHDVPADQHQIDRTKRIVERVWRSIQAGNFYPSPSPLQCPTCPFQKPCRAWKG